MIRLPCAVICSLIVIARYVMLNVVIAVLLHNFIITAQEEGLLKKRPFIDLLQMVVSLKVRASQPYAQHFILPYFAAY